MFKVLVLITLVICQISGSLAVLKFASYYGNHMVLQRGPQRAVVWGHAASTGDTVTVEVSGNGQVHTTVVHGTSGSGGVWKVKLPAITNPGPYNITAHSSEGQVILNDVLFGDVWLCSGQSNMGFTMNHVINSTAELSATLKFTNIRVFKAKTVQSATLLHDLNGISTPWSLPTRTSIPSFSAVCWLFGEYLYPHVNYPIGLVESAWGGTPIEAWSSPDAIHACSTTRQTRGPHNKYILWNSMINPLLDMTLYGAIWYQGEANIRHPDAYACQFPAMITDWRQKFHTASLGETDQNFPFGFVQLAANANSSLVGGFPPLRWSQTAKFGYVPNSKMPNTFMAVAMDLPDFHSPYGTIHPRYKQDVAHRLVLASQAVAYNVKGLDYQGPFPTSFTVDATHHRLTIEFDHGHTPIEVRNNHGYEVCCSTRTSTCGTHDHWVAAPIYSHATSTVTLSIHCGHNHPVGLRYEWQTSPCEYKQCAVYGRDNDLPAPPYLKTTAF